MKKIPLGYSDFKRIRSTAEFLYVDKTDLISEFVEDQCMVLLITRPRRFGKTLNLSTLRYFFDKDCASENRQLFDGLQVSQNKKAMDEQGTRPVIYLTFKDCKERSWEDLCVKIRLTISQVAIEMSSLQEDSVAAAEWRLISEMKDMTLSTAELSSSLFLFAKACYNSFGQKPLILIDEYDVPLQSAWTYGYWDQAIAFFRNFFSAGFKDNPYLWRGVITGCLRVARESMFTGMNNLKVASISSKSYASHFGFTIPEVKQLIYDYSLQAIEKKIESWYNGYIFGETTLYNPWSILNLIEQQGEFRNYWMNTSGNDLVKEILGRGGVQAKTDLEDLMAGKTITVPLQEQVVFQEIEKSPANLWNFLYFTGYLKAVSLKEQNDVTLVELKVPNIEVKRIFSDSVQYWFEQTQSSTLLQSLKRSLLNADLEQFTLIFEKLVSDSISYFDTAGHEPEKFYHGLVLGLIVSFSDTWQIRSNREAGFGRCDILMTPKNPDHFGIVMELKTHHPKFESDLLNTAQRALKQIEDRQYTNELLSQGATKILKLGIGFLGKEVEIVSVIHN